MDATRRARSVTWLALAVPVGVLVAVPFAVLLALAFHTRATWELGKLVARAPRAAAGLLRRQPWPSADDLAPTILVFPQRR